MSSSKRTFAAVSVVLTSALTAALTGCSSSDSTSGDPLKGDTAKGGTIVVGANNFAESVLLADVYGEALKAKGFNVQYKPNVGSRETSYGLIRNGTLTVLPEYNGSLLAYLDKKTIPKSAAEANKAIGAKLDPKLGLLEQSPAEDKDAVALNAVTAEKYHLTTESSIADLKDIGPDLVVGGSPEFQTRYTGLEGLKELYGVNFKSFKALDPGGPLTVAAMKSNNIQVGNIFTTDPNIDKNKFVILKDPKNLFGFDNVVPLVHRSDLPEKGADALNAVSAQLDTTTLISLNADVQNKDKDPLDVAKGWLKSKNLI